MSRYLVEDHTKATVFAYAQGKDYRKESMLEDYMAEGYRKVRMFAYAQGKDFGLE